MMNDGFSSMANKMLERVQESVVRVEVSSRGAGSGVVWAKNRVITNAHVVGKANSVKLRNLDGQENQARVLERNERLDLALLEVDNNLQPLELANSSSLRIGELVFAIGHPGGERLVTRGIITGLGTTGVPGGGVPKDLIRSDVTLRPGNSGGALVNANGALVGINSMIWMPNMGIAIPANTVQNWSVNTKRPAFLGVGLQPVQIPLELNQVSRLMIVSLEAESPAARDGLHAGDVILEVQGRVLEHHETLLELLETANPLDFRVLRGGHVEQILVIPDAKPWAA
jgi:serine protease Do